MLQILKMTEFWSIYNTSNASKFEIYEMPPPVILSSLAMISILGYIHNFLHSFFESFYHDFQAMKECRSSM